jgi:type IX secretion system PorP/SprF family membrane protein
MMKKIFSKIILLACSGLIVTGAAHAQDIHFSQFYETAILRNPALTGIFTEDYKVGVQYRNQWSSIGKPFRTGEVSAEMRFAVGHSSDYLSIGLLGYYDKAGRINFQTTGVYPAINYNKSLEDNHSSYLSVGFTGGFVQRSIDLSKMTFDNQYQNGGYNGSLGSGEQMPDPKLDHWDLGAGISFNSSFGQDNRNSYFLGMSAYHFTHPKQSFYNDANVINLQTRWNMNAGISLTFDDAWSTQLYGNYMLQGSYQEIIAGGLLRWSKFNNLNRRDFAFSGGVFYRVNDAVIPTVKLEYKGQAFEFSYDVNISTLRTVSNLRGGFEISFFRSGFFNGGYDDKHLCPRF